MLTIVWLINELYLRNKSWGGVLYWLTTATWVQGITFPLLNKDFPMQHRDHEVSWLIWWFLFRVYRRGLEIFECWKMGNAVIMFPLLYIMETSVKIGFTFNLRICFVVKHERKLRLFCIMKHCALYRIPTPAVFWIYCLLWHSQAYTWCTICIETLPKIHPDITF